MTSANVPIAISRTLVPKRVDGRIRSAGRINRNNMYLGKGHLRHGVPGRPLYRGDPSHGTRTSSRGSAFHAVG
jgi:hypothetical protein